MLELDLRVIYGSQVKAFWFKKKKSKSEEKTTDRVYSPSYLDSPYDFKWKVGGNSQVSQSVSAHYYGLVSVSPL